MKYSRVFTAVLVASPRAVNPEPDAFDNRFVAPEFECEKQGDTLVIVHKPSGRVQHCAWELVCGAQPVAVVDTAPIPSEPTRVTGKAKR